jgi:hypothetical protein
MNLEHGCILFNRTVDQCRIIGRRGGLARGRNLQARKSAPAPPALPVSPLHEETIAEARARIDALCPWLRGAEIRTTRR